MKTNKVRLRVEPLAIRLNGDCVSSRPIRKEPAGLECSLKSKLKKLKRVKKLFSGKSLVPDFMTLLASVIIPEFVEVEFCPWHNAK